MARTVAVYFLPSETAEQDFEGRTVVVVDLLRASTSIATALASGARDVVPTDSPEHAFALRQTMGHEPNLLCGERRGEMIPGFDLGNSPREYTRQRVEGKRLIYASSNGSAAILRARKGVRLSVGALVNATAVTRWVESYPEDCVVLCSGKLGQFAGEDAACAGYLVNRLAAAGFHAVNDAARLAAETATAIGDRWLPFVRATDHGSYLAGLGFADDFPVVCARDSLDVLPTWDGDRLVAQSRTEE